MIKYPVKQYYYKNVCYTFNKYGREEYTLYDGKTELFFDCEKNIRFYIDNIELYRGK